MSIIPEAACLLYQKANLLWESFQKCHNHYLMSLFASSSVSSKCLLNMCRLRLAMCLWVPPFTTSTWSTLALLLSTSLPTNSLNPHGCAALSNICLPRNTLASRPSWFCLFVVSLGAICCEGGGEFGCEAESDWLGDGRVMSKCCPTNVSGMPSLRRSRSSSLIISDDTWQKVTIKCTNRKVICWDAVLFGFKTFQFHRNITKSTVVIRNIRYKCSNLIALNHWSGGIKCEPVIFSRGPNGFSKLSKKI